MITAQMKTQKINTETMALVEVNIYTQQITSMNEQGLDLLGFSQDDIDRGIYAERIFAEKEYERCIETVKDYLNRHQGPNDDNAGKRDDRLFDIEMMKKDGSHFTCEGLGSLALNAQKIPVGLHLEIRDVTVQRQMERALKENEKWFLDAFDYGGTGRVILDHSGHFFMVNEALCDMLGYTQKDLMNKTESEITYLEDWPKKDEYLKQLSEGTINSFRYEHRYIHSDGSSVWVDMNVVRLEDMGKHTNYLLGDIVDISKRKEEEEKRADLATKLSEAQKFESIGIMASGIAHEFNNILQSLFLYGGIVQRQLPDDETLQSNYQHIIEASNRAKDLVRQILTFTRQGESELKPVKIQYLIKDALKLIRASLPSGIEIKESIDTECGAVFCDPTQIHQAFLNLCANAEYAMHENGGLLEVSLKEIEIGSSGTDGMPEKQGLELIIKDNGTGPRLDTSTVEDVIKDAQGVLFSKVEPDGGMMFRAEFPIYENKEDEKVNTDEQESAKGDLRILFVDDDVEISGAGKVVLEVHGYHVDTANSAKDALALFTNAQDAYHLLITDMIMPEMTGLELVQEIRKLSKELPILMMSGRLDTEVMGDYHSLGINGFIRKPWTAEEMINAIRSIKRS